MVSVYRVNEIGKMTTLIYIVLLIKGEFLYTRFDSECSRDHLKNVCNNVFFYSFVKKYCTSLLPLYLFCLALCIATWH